VDLNLLKTFCAVSRTLNISKAAEQRNLTQPAVSLQIKQLESIIGSALFLRHPIRLTETGEHLLVNAQEILSKWQSTLDFVQQEQALTKGTLTIACSDAVLRYCLLPIVAEFRDKYPGIHLALLNRTSLGAQQAVIEGKADFAIALFQNEHPKLIHKPFLNYNEVAVVPNDHPLAKQKSVNAQRLNKEPLLLLEEKTLTRTLTLNWFTQQNLNIYAPMALGSVDAQIEMTRQGAGIALISVFTVPPDLVSVKVKKLPSRQLAIYYQNLKPAVRAW